jgi:hypothetical protein
MQGMGGNPYLVHAVVRVVVDMQAGILLSDLKQVYVRAVLAGLVAGGVVMVTDLVARLSDGLLLAGPVGALIGAVDGQYLVLTVDHDKRFLVTLNQ